MIVGKSDNGKEILVMEEDFAASFLDGKWVSGIRFTAYEMHEYLTKINGDEAVALLEQAREALGNNV